jgi:hypothetical protein
MVPVRTLAAPVAMGSLRERPAEHLYLYARKRRLSGTLILQSAASAVVAEVVLETGNMHRIATAFPAPLGVVLYELGFIDSDTLNRSLQAMSGKRSHHAEQTETQLHQGTFLVQAGAISHAQLAAGLVEQMERKLASTICQPRDTQWSFHEGTNTLSSYGCDDWPTVEVLGGVWRGLRETPFTEALEFATLRAQCMHMELRTDLVHSQCRFTEGETAFINAFRSGATFDDVVSPLSDATKKRLFYFLLLTGSLELAHAGAPLSAPPSSQTGGPLPSFRMPAGIVIEDAHVSGMRPKIVQRVIRPPEQPLQRPAAPIPEPILEPVHGARSGLRDSRVSDYPKTSLFPSQPPVRAVAGHRDAVIALERKLDTLDHFQVLGVARNATVEELRAQFFRLSRQFHPDKQARENADLGSQCTRISARLGEAFRVLSDELLRQRYVAESGGQSREDPRELARLAHRVLARSYIEARSIAHRAKTLDTANLPEVSVASAWVLAQEPAAQDDAGYKNAILVFDRIIREFPDYGGAYYYRAQVHRRLGNAFQVLKDLRTTLEYDSDHVDAAREIRLFRMRTEGGMNAEAALGMEPSKQKSASLEKLVAVVMGRKPR